MCGVHGDSSGLVLTTDPKPRLRWTVELHERFVDAVAQLGGPDSACFCIYVCVVTFFIFSGFDEYLYYLVGVRRGDTEDDHESYGG